MIDLSTPNEWQYRDESLGILFPWYTKPALDEIVSWDLKGKLVWEYGCGASTLWWAAKCKKLYGMEYNVDYHAAVSERLGNNAVIMHNKNGDESVYVNAAKYCSETFDIIIIDGEYRDACVPVALECLKPGGKLIFDNWMQPEVEMQTMQTQAIVLALPHQIYKQEGHKYWQTLIATKPREITDFKLTEVSLLPNGEYGIGYTHKHTD